MEKIQGGEFTDDRGQIRFVNEFDMSRVKRFYIIKNKDTEFVRGWRAHRVEERWFYALSGSFIIDLVLIDNWNSASPDLPVRKYRLSSENQQIIHVPAGYGTAIQALESNSELLVFADHGIENAKNDDYTWPISFFINRIR
ncbi:WxcM-like domain-containing protein [Sphingobacterium hungaricum]